MTLRNAPTSMVVKSVYNRAEKIHPFLFCVYNRLRGGCSSSLTSWDFSISCFDHIKIYCLSYKRWCCKFCDFRVTVGITTPIFSGLSIVKFLCFFVTFRRTELTAARSGSKSGKNRTCRRNFRASLVLRGMIFTYDSFFLFPNFLKSCNFVIL